MVASIIEPVFTDLITIFVEASLASIRPCYMAKGPTAESIFPHVGP